MNKRFLGWLLVAGAAAFVASQFVARPHWRAFLSSDYWSSLIRYGQVMRIVESTFVHAGEVDFRGLTDTALREAVGSLDEYSAYMTPEAFERFNRSAKREYVGVGIEVRQFSGRVIVSEVFPQGGADEAGLAPGDFIVGVDGEDVRGKPLAEVVERIRGAPGTRVRLEIERPVEDTALEREIERRRIALASVVDREVRGGGVGYLRVRQFTEDTPAELAEGIRALRDEGMRGLILDLRGNPGGRLRSAAEMAELFLEEGRTILTVESRRGVREEFRVTAEEPVFRRPLVVLIDGRSASASEILAGALRDYGRAVLVGARTFGKGSVQSVFGFDGGRGLKLTTARYLLPGGDAINGEGVAPDVAVGAAPGAGVVRMLQEHHLRRMDADAFAAAFGFSPVGDRQLEVAGALLRGVLARRDAESGEGPAESPPEA